MIHPYHNQVETAVEIRWDEVLVRRVIYLSLL